MLFLGQNPRISKTTKHRNLRFEVDFSKILKDNFTFILLRLRLKLIEKYSKIFKFCKLFNIA